MEPNNITPRFQSIELLRAIAVTMVITLHVIELGGWTQFPTSWPFVYLRIGWLGVDLFFVISGFAITWSAISLRHKTLAYYKEFFIHRFARIAPLYALTCCVFMILFRSEYFNKSAYEWSTDILLHAVFLHNILQRTAGSLNGVTWSLGLEVQFYLISAFLTPIFIRMGAIKTLVILIICAWLLTPGIANPQLQVFFTSFQLPGAIDEFSFGIATAICLHKREDFLAKIRSNKFYATTFLLLSIIIFSTSVKILQMSNPYWSTTSIIVFWRTLTAASFLFLLLWAISHDYHIILKPIASIGIISYGMYLWHLIVLKILISTTNFKGIELLVSTFFITSAISYLSWNYFEKPLIGIIRGKIPNQGKFKIN